MPASPVKSFLWRVLLWLPICFACWYLMAALFTLPVAWVSHFLLVSLLPEAVRAVEPSGQFLDIVTAIPPPPSAASTAQGQIGELIFEINGLIYSYSLPLFTGLLLASPGSEKQKWLRWTFGAVVLLLVQAWGVSFDALKTILFNLGPDAAALVPMGDLGKNLVALGYQFGTLILPAVTPLILWIGLHREFLNQLAPGMLSRFKAGA